MSQTEAIAASAAFDPAEQTFQLSRALDIWQARFAVLAIAALQFLLVNDLANIPRFVLPTLEIALLIPLSLATAWTLRRTRAATTAEHWYDVSRYSSAVRLAFLLLVGLVSLANLVELYGLVVAMLGGHAANGRSLLLDSLNVWLTNVVVFALWYWNLDRQASPDEPRIDFLFTQQTIPGVENAPPFVPGFVDYLFLAFTNATAFSPADTYPLTHRAKLLMILQALVSLTTIALVASRAVGILS